MSPNSLTAATDGGGMLAVAELWERLKEVAEGTVEMV